MKFEIVTCADLDTIPQATNPAMSLWGDYVRDGLITFMVSPPLTVKTTLLSYLLSMWSNEGGNFCGPVAPCHVLYLSEDPAPLWPKRKQALGFGPTASWVFRYNALQMSWQEICDGGCEWVENVVKEYGDVSAIFVVDTLGSFARLENENDAAQVKAAMSKLYPIWDIGAAVLATGHTRKSGGRDGNAVLGSTAFA